MYNDAFSALGRSLRRDRVAFCRYHLYAAIGSLKLKPSARKLMVVMAAIQLILVLVNLADHFRDDAAT